MLMIAMMIISIGALMHRAVTYYKHEPWEEYLTLIGNIELNSRRLVELSLANYTNTPNQTNPNILKNNLEKWQTDLLRIYPGREIVLTHNSLGLNYSWFLPKSFSTAKATFTLNIASIGLTGYNFTAVAFLNLTLLDALWYEDNNVGVRLTVKEEGPTLVTNLEEANFVLFQVNGTDRTFSFHRYYDTKTYNSTVYELRYNAGSSKPSAITVKITIVDLRGIKVTGEAVLTVKDA